MRDQRQVVPVSRHSVSRHLFVPGDDGRVKHDDPLLLDVDCMQRGVNTLFGKPVSERDALSPTQYP